MLPDKLVMAGITVLIFVTDYNILAPLDKKKSKKFWVQNKLRSKNAAQGRIMQALYATPAWACCFYVFTYFTLFLSGGVWNFLMHDV